LYSVLKHSQVSYNHAQPYFVAQPRDFQNVEYGNELECELDSAELTEKREQEELQVNHKYNQILSDAKRQAEAIIRDAQEEGNRLAKAREKEGFEQGTMLAQKKHAEEMEKLEKLKLDLQEEFERKVAEFKNDILYLSLTLTQKIIKTECEKDDTIILNILDSVVNKYRDEKNLTVEVSKNNFDKLTSSGTKPDYNLRMNEEFDDTNIQVSLDNGIIDASIDVQFENLKQAILKESLYYGV